MEVIARCGCGSGQQNKGSAIACNFLCFILHESGRFKLIGQGLYYRQQMYMVHF